MVFGIFPRLIFLFYTAQVRTWKIVLIPVLDQGIKWQFIKPFRQFTPTCAAAKSQESVTVKKAPEKEII